MTQLEIDALEHASRSSMVWSPEEVRRRGPLEAIVDTLAVRIGTVGALVASLFLPR